MHTHTPGNNIADQGALALADIVPALTALTTLNLSCTLVVSQPTHSLPALTRLLPPSSLAANLKMTPTGYTALLKQALQCPHFAWVRHIAGQAPSQALSDAGLRPELQGDRDGIVSYLQQMRQDSGKAADTAFAPRRRATVVVLGYQRVGKTSLVWRLRHRDDTWPGDSISTPGIATGARHSIGLPHPHLLTPTPP